MCLNLCRLRWLMFLALMSLALRSFAQTADMAKAGEVGGLRRMVKEPSLRVAVLEHQMQRQQVAAAIPTSAASAAAAVLTSSVAAAQYRPMASPECREQVPESSTLQESQPVSPQPHWHYGGFTDLGYLLDFNHPANEIFRSRGTTWHVDDVHLNMAAAYIRKDATAQSRSGTQLTV